MKSQNSRRASQIFIAVAFFAIASVSLGDQSSTSGIELKDVKEKAMETGQAIKNYSFKKRDEAVKKAKAALDEMDKRIATMESKFDKKWNEMDQSAREKGRATMAKLRKQRNETAEWYGGLKHSSSKAWVDVKKGFLKSYKELRESVDRAYSEY
ncbi:MAG TPA: hypothetical protein VLZ07_10155 [Syntrophales bacterium]|nr:hypothetical protein [Syntrophales bacterium]